MPVLKDSTRLPRGVLALQTRRARAQRRERPAAARQPQARGHGQRDHRISEPRLG